jgi:hypothetical protein
MQDAPGSRNYKLPNIEIAILAGLNAVAIGDKNFG